MYTIFSGKKSGPLLKICPQLWSDFVLKIILKLLLKGQIEDIFWRISDSCNIVFKVSASVLIQHTSTARHVLGQILIFCVDAIFEEPLTLNSQQKMRSALLGRGDP